MQLRGIRWKALKQTLDNSSFISESQSRSKSKKFNPVRKPHESSLTSKFKTLNGSVLNTSTDPANMQNKEHETSLRGSFIKNQSSPKRSESQISLRYQLKTNGNEELASPTPLIRQLQKISKAQNAQFHLNPSKVLFSNEQTTRNNLYQELVKIKQDLYKLKYLVETQLLKQRKQMNQIVNKVSIKLQEVLLACLQNNKLSKLDSNICIQTNNFNPAKIDSPDLSIIKRQSSMNDSKSEIKKIFHEQSIKLQKAIDKAISSNNLQQINLKNALYQPAKTDRLLQYRSTQMVRNINPREKSKKQFQKLFSAVNCLKKQIKDLNQINSQIPQKQKQINGTNFINEPDLQINEKNSQKNQVEKPVLKELLELRQKRSTKVEDIKVNNNIKIKVKSLFDSK